MSVKFSNASTYPLHWPEGFPKSNMRTSNNRFDTTLFKALENVQKALQAFARDSGKKMSDVIISSNYSLSEQKPREPGVAVYFTWDGERTCIPVDRYMTIEDNLQAIYHCIEAKRTMLRHGGINLVKAAFRGYAALPPSGGVVDWRSVLGYHGSNLEEAKQAWRAAISRNHPDRGGDTGAAARINAAWEAAQAELGR